ncbi:hypothetical protein [Marinicrinis lubricantis]|uniref:Uncharacterized protein n=1 Tax=Marinicrinis lubricantis TaxID=2086470 RepID=A0ABW1IQN1_9BACL
MVKIFNNNKELVLEVDDQNVLENEWLSIELSKGRYYIFVENRLTSNNAAYRLSINMEGES